MGFYNVAQGDAPYLTKLACKYTLADNYHQPVMGGTYANFMMLGYADALYYADDNGDPAKPDHVLSMAPTRPYMSTRSKTPIRCLEPITGTLRTDIRVEATLIAPTKCSRASPRLCGI